MKQNRKQFQTNWTHSFKTNRHDEFAIADAIESIFPSKNQTHTQKHTKRVLSNKMAANITKHKQTTKTKTLSNHKCVKCVETIWTVESVRVCNLKLSAKDFKIEYRTIAPNQYRIITHVFSHPFTYTSWNETMRHVQNAQKHTHWMVEHTVCHTKKRKPNQMKRNEQEPNMKMICNRKKNVHSLLK